MIITVSLRITPTTVLLAYLPDWLRHVDDGKNELLDDMQMPLYPAYRERTYPRIEQAGVHIMDMEHGVGYEVVAERRNGRPVLLRKSVFPYGVDAISDASQLADEDLAALAVAYLEEVDPLDVSQILDHEPKQHPKPARVRPSLERIVQLATDAAGIPKPARQHIKDVAHVSLPTADRWLREARDAGMLPQPVGNRGRPPKTTKPHTKEN